MNVFKKIWNSISLNGIESQSEARLVRTRVLSNQLNATVFTLTLIVYIVVTLIRLAEQSQLYALQERFFLVLGMNILHFLLVRYKCFTSAKLLLIFVLPLLIIVLPTVLGHVTNQSFFNYVFILISLSVLPQLILYFKKQKVLYVISLIYYLLLLFTNRSLLTAFASPELEIVPLIEKYSFLYEIISIAIALFVNLMMYNLNRINVKVEQQLLEGKEKLEAINQNLDLHIEELKATNEQLRNTQQQLIQSEKMVSLGVLTAGVAHEVNTPLNFISTGSLLMNNALEDLSDGVSREEIKQQLQQGSEIINKGIDQASFVVSSLMTFSYSGKSTRKWHNLSNIIDSTLLFIKAKMPKDISIQKSYELKNEVLVFADKMHQVILNIIDNALGELQESKTKELLIRTYMQKKGNRDYACISIYNSGSRISDEVGKRIFDPFFTTKSINQGTGLGLSLAYNLVSDHDGVIRYQNVNNGVEFIIELPIYLPEEL